MVVSSLQHLKSRKLTEEEETKAFVVGWCVEWVRRSHKNRIIDQKKL